MNIIDISWPLSTTTTSYKDENPIQIEQLKTFEQDTVRESNITLTSHTGTHIDAPAHFMEKGATIDQIPLTALYGSCMVVDMTYCAESIGIKDLQSVAIAPHSIMLFKTKNSALAPDAPFNPHFVYLAHDGARYLVAKKVKAVGIDYLGIERNQPNHETHTTLLGANIPIIEGLRLSQVSPGAYTFICLPLALQGLDGAPARAILL